MQSLCMQVLSQQRSPISVAGDCMEGRLVRRARLLRSGLSYPGHSAVRLSPQPRGSLSSLVAVLLPNILPGPHEVGVRETWHSKHIIYLSNASGLIRLCSEFFCIEYLPAAPSYRALDKQTQHVAYYGFFVSWHLDCTER